MKICSTFLSVLVIALCGCSRSSQPLAGPDKLQHFEGFINHNRQTYDPVKSDLYVRASQALKSGDARSAEALYRDLIAKYPDDPDSYSALGTCLFFQDRNEEARTNYLRAMELDSQSASALYGLGCVAYKRGQSTEAKDYLEEVLVIEPQNVMCHRLLGSLYEQLGDSPSAVMHYNRAIALDSSAAENAGIKKRLQALQLH
jgi:Tfp pilus assembly protein PilF